MQLMNRNERLRANSPRRRLLRRLAAAVVLTAQSGCFLAAPPQHGEVVHNALPTTAIPLAWNQAAQPDGAVSDDWLKSFNDPKLDGIVSEAIANNTDLRQAAARVEVARQNVVVVGAALMPQINASFAGSALVTDSKSGDPTSPSNDHTANVEYATISWEIDVWGKLRAQKAASEANFEATALDYDFARQSLAATTAKTWYLATETRQLLSLAQRDVDLYTQLDEVVRTRREFGAVADLDVAEANASLNAARSQLRVAQGHYAESLYSLEILLGRFPAGDIEVGDTFPTAPNPVGPGLPSSLLERRPDIVAAEREVLAAFRNEEAARLALLPQFVLTVEGGRLSDQLLSVLGLNPWLFYSALRMAVPIYEGGALRAELKIATAQQQQAIAYYGSVALTAFSEVQVALTNEQLLTQRLQYEMNALKDRTVAVQTANLRYVYGSVDLFEVLELQTQQIENEELVINLRAAQLTNRIDLHLALGGSFDMSPAGSLQKISSARGW